jgi:signal transduction histidine kinase
LPIEKRVVSVRLASKKGEITIIVRDHGCGISQAVIDKIFDPFFTTKERHRGMGIGLSNTKDIVTKDFKGTIKVKSTEGEGSNFTIAFPRAHQTFRHQSGQHTPNNGKQTRKIDTESAPGDRVLAEEGRRV